MVTHRIVDVSRELPPEPSSARLARRMVTETLEAGHLDHLDVAALLVSELVTNVVLHAGTTFELRCRAEVGRVRVEVSDGSVLAPGVRHYQDEATTGRGLELVEALAARWGVEYRPDGKTVWFELGDAGEASAVAPPEEPDEDRFRVVLPKAPLTLLSATIEYGDAVLRELALLALAGELPDDLMEAWRPTAIDVTPILAAIVEAAAAGGPIADVDFTLPGGAGAHALDRFALIEIADRLARDGQLLVAPVLPEIGLCRHWLWRQIAEQETGARPEPWRPTAPLEPSRQAMEIPAAERQRLESNAVATIVADDSNQIVALNAAAADLLGWDGSSLVGQRLTMIIPPELRDAHLAGYSRLLMTGETRILGRTMQVPALRRDGRRVEVQLTIERLPGDRGRSAFRAELHVLKR